MNTKPAVVLLSGLLFACAPPAAAPPAPPPAPVPTAAPTPAPAPAPVAGDRSVAIRRVTCATFIALPEDDRAAVAMFYMGYQANRARLAVVYPANIPSVTGLAVDLCSAEPNRTVVSVFAEAGREVRRW